MNKEDLRDVVAHLETLDALAKLFKNLWFDKVKKAIEDEKVKAYLMVFDDAFPGMNHVIEFVRRNAEALAEGETATLREEFEVLAQQLLQREIETELEIEEDLEIEEEMFEEEGVRVGRPSKALTEEERKALEQVDQRDIDSLFAEEQQSLPPTPKAKASKEELEALLAAEGEEEVEASLAELEEEEEEEVEEPLEEEGEEEEEILAAEEDDLGGLLEEEEEGKEEEVEEQEEEEEIGLDELIAEEEDAEAVRGPEISEDEMAALLEEGEELAEKPKPSAKKKAVQVPAKKPLKKSRREGLEEEEEEDGEGSISQDEIDKLFG